MFPIEVSRAVEEVVAYWLVVGMLSLRCDQDDGERVAGEALMVAVKIANWHLTVCACNGS